MYGGMYGCVCTVVRAVEYGSVSVFELTVQFTSIVYVVLFVCGCNG